MSHRVNLLQGDLMTPKQLKAFRARHDLTQVQLAERLGVKSNTVARWEGGIHPIPQIVENFCQMIDGKKKEQTTKRGKRCKA